LVEDSFYGARERVAPAVVSSRGGATIENKVGGTEKS
jgi:hypothetical protein